MSLYWRGVVVQVAIILAATIALCLAMAMHYESAITSLVAVFSAIASAAFMRARSSSENPPLSGSGPTPPPSVLIGDSLNPPTLRRDTQTRQLAVFALVALAIVVAYTWPA
jgi:hypothetical protein